ncbi:MAG: HAMP domain-containing histidine kinase [Oscillospiraceae bacterium]|nr:HAMP domain-containing histidine kinase [Oscillospiraceae bacterium]
MKHYAKFLAVTALCFAGLLVFFMLSTSPGRIRQDAAIRINDMVQTVREHWDDPDTLRDKEYGGDIYVFDSSDRLRYPADGALRSPAEAAQQGYLCQPVISRGILLGTAAVPDPAAETVGLLRKRILKSAALILLCILAALAAVGIYLRRAVVTPFRRMKQFAGKIAEGNLDEPLQMEKSDLFGVFTESFDIMREELRAARLREEALRQREKELIASLSHDMKTPVTGIRLICELLTVKTDDAYLRGKVADISQKADQINLLVSDLLASSLDELGEMHVNCQDEPSSVLHDLASEHDTKNLVSEEAVPECLICIDRIRLSQVIANIISNSYKYAGTAIDIRYRFSEDFLDMAIEDHGGGVPAEELAQITQKYYRGKENTSGRDGSGLGLYIADALMRKMHGALRCSCESGGLCVTLSIPLSGHK